MAEGVGVYSGVVGCKGTLKLLDSIMVCMSWTHIVDVADGTGPWLGVPFKHIYVEGDEDDALDVLEEKCGITEVDDSQTIHEWPTLREATCFERGGTADTDSMEWLEEPDEERGFDEVEGVEEFANRADVAVVPSEEVSTLTSGKAVV